MLFTRIARLDLIERLAPTILIPNAVVEEVRAGQRKDSSAERAVEWAARYCVEDMPALRLVPVNLSPAK
jgi:hypothetical protein